MSAFCKSHKFIFPRIPLLIGITLLIGIPLLIAIAMYSAFKINRHTLSSATRPGDVVSFGSYRQSDTGDQAGKEEAIEWIVLDVENGKALLISRYALEAKSYDSQADAAITWEECSLRNWLNDEFLKETFTLDQQSRIIKTELTNDDNIEYGTEGGSNTEDYIFCLSQEEAEQYFQSNADRYCFATEYAIAHGVRTFSGSGSCLWWLRSPGMGSAMAAYVSSDGSISSFGNFVRDEGVAVRPALWAELHD